MVDEFHPQLLISDLEMPEMDGGELLAKLRGRTGADANITSLCISGTTDPLSRTRCEATGFQHFVQKPVSLPAVLGLMEMANVSPWRAVGYW